MADRMYTSSEADEILSALRFETKLEKVTLARMAFALSASKVGEDVPQSPNFGGGEMKRPTFFANDEPFIRALLSYTYTKPDINEDELFSNHSITKNHIDHGAELLSELFQACGRSGDGLIAGLVEEVELFRSSGECHPRTEYFHRPDPVSARRVNNGAQQHGAPRQLSLGNYGQARGGQDAMFAKDACRHSHTVELSDELYLFRLQG